MTRALGFALVVVALTATTPGQQPQIQNGRVETRQATSLDRDIATLAAGATDPVWVAWRVPMIDGQRQMCCWYYNDWSYNDQYGPYGVRGCLVESNPTGSTVPKIAPPTGPVPLEAGTGLVMLVRVVDRHVERLRTFGDDCPLDANGRTVYWLDRVSPADSLKFLDSLTHPDYGTMTRGGADSLASAAISAIGLHRDAGADPILDRLASSDPDSSVRRRAASSLGNARGAHGFETLRRLIGTEHVTDVRRGFVTAIGQSRQPQTADVLLTLAKSDADASVRASALYYLPQRGGQGVISQVTALIDSDRDDNVKRRGVAGLAQLPADAGVPTLIQLARSDSDPVVRRQAVTELGHSRDPRAVAFLQEMLKQP